MAMQDETGNQISFEDWEFQNKYIAYKDFHWSEQNTIDLTSFDGSILKNYRKTAFGERKGIIHFVHGYGDSGFVYAYLASQFANHGYEFCAIDQQGFGHSEGVRGRIENMQESVSDIENFSQKYMEKYGDENTKFFLMGNSLGGLISSLVASKT